MSWNPNRIYFNSNILLGDLGILQRVTRPCSEKCFISKWSVERFRLDKSDEHISYGVHRHPKGSKRADDYSTDVTIDPMRTADFTCHTDVILFKIEECHLLILKIALLIYIFVRLFTHVSRKRTVPPNGAGFPKPYQILGTISLASRTHTHMYVSK